MLSIIDWYCGEIKHESKAVLFSFVLPRLLCTLRWGVGIVEGWGGWWQESPDALPAYPHPLPPSVPLLRCLWYCGRKGNYSRIWGRAGLRWVKISHVARENTSGRGPSWAPSSAEKPRSGMGLLSRGPWIGKRGHSRHDDTSSSGKLVGRLVKPVAFWSQTSVYRTVCAFNK